MYFEDEERFLAPEIRVVRHELYAINANLEPFGARYVPTHTEDGIPIRKLYVSNLPPKTTRRELHTMFAPYGFIKSCWLRMGERGPSRIPTPTYAFVTYSNPGDAHKALQAPPHEKIMRGRSLHVSPADSWHQPIEESDAVNYKPSRPPRPPIPNELSNLVRSMRGMPTFTVEPFPGTPTSSAHASSSEHEPKCSSSKPEESYIEPLHPPDNKNNGEGTNSSPSAESPATSSKSENSEQQAVVSSRFPTDYTILDILNNDCLTHILGYIPMRDLIRSERVSKEWQAMIRDYLNGIRVFKTSWWQHVPVILTTAVLRKVLQRVGRGLTRLHIDHHWSALNDRTAHTVGKFCPYLEELKIVGMHTRNWNPLIYGCKELKTISFVSCNKLIDTSLVHLVKNDSNLESLTIANNTHVTGLFLNGSKPPKLSSLSFYNCYSLQGTVLSAAMGNLPMLTTLKLDVCPHTMWKVMPTILSKLPKLEELSVSEYVSVEMYPHSDEAFCEALSTLSELKRLNLSRNIYITNAILKKVAQSCPKLESLNVSSCNSRRHFPHTGVSDEGIAAVCRGCHYLTSVDVSYLAAMTDAGLASLAKLSLLGELTARGNPTISAAPLTTIITSCPQLRLVDICGCDGVSEDIVAAAVRALTTKPRAMLIRMAGTITAPETQEELSKHPLLTVDIDDDRSNPHLRPDFVDRIFEDSSDDSLIDLYDHDDFDDMFDPDDENFMDDELDDFDGLYEIGLQAPNFILL